MARDFREILNFWFEEPKSFDEKVELWFGGAPETDDRIRKIFEEDVIAAFEGRYDEWRLGAESCLALVILLDQFSLNIYRDLPRSFLVNGRALPIALDAIGKGLDREVAAIRRIFYYLPLEHAEDRQIQARAVSLVMDLGRDAASEERRFFDGALRFARMHQEIIERFGRFPDRNEILGRESTPEEVRFLEEEGSPF